MFLLRMLSLESVSLLLLHLLLLLLQSQLFDLGQPRPLLSLLIFPAFFLRVRLYGLDVDVWGRQQSV
jgi:hypothetical protein